MITSENFQVTANYSGVDNKLKHYNVTVNRSNP